MNRRRAISALLFLLLLVGCSRPAPKPEGPPKDAPPQQTEPKPQVPPELEALFPAGDLEMRFRLYEKQQPEAIVQEVWLREPNRLVGVIDGRAYVTWHLGAEGVWRKDPKGNTLLLYLPPVLQDGLVWKQRSGDAEVLFRLERRNDGCTGPCWTVRVMNRGEITAFSFAPGQGPYEAQSEHYTQPELSFFKLRDGLAGEKANPPGEQRAAWLKTAPAPPTSKAQVLPAAQADWEAGIDKLPNITVSHADLDGDGKPEWVRGQLGVWSAASLEIRRGDTGDLIIHKAPPGGQHNLRLVTFTGSKRTYVAMQAKWERGPYFSLLHLAGGHLQGIFGWAPKVTAGTATSAKVSPDGLITLDWEMGDPAGHIRTRKYRFTEEPLKVMLESESFRPAGPELKYPASPEELVRAVWTARWYTGLDSELERYFETPQATAAFRATDKTGKPYYDNGLVSMATAVTQGKPPQCNLRKQVAPPKDGILSFVAEWSGYEEWTGTAGRAVVVQKDGRWVIREIQIDQECWQGL